MSAHLSYFLKDRYSEKVNTSGSCLEKGQGSHVGKKPEKRQTLWFLITLPTGPFSWKHVHTLKCPRMGLKVSLHNGERR